jgi:hypothetical protein
MSPDLVRIGPIEAIDGTPVIDTKPVVGSKGLLICQRDCSRPKVDSIFVQPLSISGIVERPTGEETIPPNQQNEAKQCDSWL